MRGTCIAFLREVSNPTETRKVLVEIVQQALGGRVNPKFGTRLAHFAQPTTPRVSESLPVTAASRLVQTHDSEIAPPTVRRRPDFSGSGG
jgi:hypothetical protein